MNQLDHLAGDALRQEIGSIQVGFQNVIEGLLVGFKNILANLRGDARAVDEQIDPTEALHRIRHEEVTMRCGRDISLAHVGGGARFLDALPGLLRRFKILIVVNQDGEAGFSQFDADRPPDPPGAARNQSHLFLDHCRVFLQPLEPEPDRAAHSQAGDSTGWRVQDAGKPLCFDESPSAPAGPTITLSANTQQVTRIPIGQENEEHPRTGWGRPQTYRRSAQKNRPTR